jgi:uncharacterized small protein (DUF1192 family)
LATYLAKVPPDAVRAQGARRQVEPFAEAHEAEHIMVEDPDDLPRRPSAKPPDLANWSIEELEAYIQRLEGEIARARAAIEARRSVRGAAEALFKKG